MVHGHHQFLMSYSFYICERIREFQEALNQKALSISIIVNLIFYDTNLKKDIKLGIGDSFNFDSELKTYLQSLPGVELFNKQP